MNKLPSEVIVEIASNLPLSDKLNLAFITKNVHKVLQETTLYESLTFKNIDQFNQAMNLCRKKNFGHLVRNLHIKMMDCTSEIIIGLPTVFPGVRHLYWGGYTSDRLPSVKFNTALFSEMAENWITNMESIFDYSCYLDLSTHLLETAACHRLTSIDISFFSFPLPTNITYNKIRVLIASIHDAPSLERVTLKYTAIRLEDLEALHRSTPHLKLLNLDSIQIYSSDTRDLGETNPAESIERLSTKEIMLDDVREGRDQILENVLHNWILYIGGKYTQLSELELRLNTEFFRVENQGLVSAALVSALSNLTHVKKYAVNLIPPTQQVLEILNGDNIQLEYLMISLNALPATEETFNIVAAAHSTSTVSSLLVECDHATNSLAISRGFMLLGRSLTHLTHLKIDYGYTANVVLLIVDVLQNLTLLENLEFGV